MRFLLLLVACGLLFLSANAAPQPADTAVLRVNSLSPNGSTNGLLLEKGWRYQGGDNPHWAQPGFDDSRWDTLNPTRPRRELPTSLQEGVSWLRLRLRLSDSLPQRSLLLMVEQLGAAEVYLDGQLVQRQGRFATASTPLHPGPGIPEPVELIGGDAAEHVVAVRLALWSPWLFPGISNQALLQPRLRTESQFRQRDARRAASGTIFYVVGGISLLLALLHFAFFHYYPAQRANRYFALYALAQALASIGLYYNTLRFDDLYPALGLEFFTYVLFFVSSLWAVRALYALFRYVPGRMYGGLQVSCGVLILAWLLTWFTAFSFPLYLTFVGLALAEVLRLTGRALRQRKRGAGIIALGFIIGLFFVVLVVGLGTAQVTLPPLLRNFLFALIYLPPALGISLFLAREFALDSQLLQVQLGEVERLSAQTIAQEQEKQALLAAQNETLEQQVTQRTEQLQRSLTDLRATQAQLIQKEKMASLGELTAGIAHEIQNPLNFVTNFSDLSSELVAELREEQAKGGAADATLQQELFEDLTQNLDKISHHGRRAAGIVKGMLEHSQTSAGERRPTNLNGLTEEYLRLAYQGLRAKDKAFNVELSTDFAPELTPVTMVGPDVGRVLLNLFTNAFYAVRQRQQAGEAGYQPTVRVSTQQVDGQVHIRVQDNGTGMSPAVREKIFQPFFTTKPPGEGTGLGLSLSYDIIAQGHGGRLAVESQEGHGSEFTVSLPH